MDFFIAERQQAPATRSDKTRLISQIQNEIRRVIGILCWKWYLAISHRPFGAATTEWTPLLTGKWRNIFYHYLLLYTVEDICATRTAAKTEKKVCIYQDIRAIEVQKRAGRVRIWVFAWNISRIYESFWKEFAHAFKDLNEFQPFFAVAAFGIISAIFFFADKIFVC